MSRKHKEINEIDDYDKVKPNSVQGMVTEFHKQYGQRINKPPPMNLAALTLDEEQEELEGLYFRWGLITEEFGELEDEFWPEGQVRDPQKVAKELADLVYVLYGLAVEWGINLNDVIRSVHESNMTKEQNPGGKPIKGKAFIPAEL